MRRSKSDPAKYARNYRKISQRHMTGYGDDATTTTSTTAGGKKKFDETKEQKRLEAILQQSEQTWKRGLAESGHGDVHVGGSKNKKETNGGKSKAQEEVDNNEQDDNDNNDNNDMLSLLSPELRQQFSGMGSDNLLILPSKKKKKQNKQQLPPLTPAEIKAAKSLYKNTQRKLQQLTQRRHQKETRSNLYKQLEANSNTKEAASLLLKSSELGKKVTKKQHLKLLRQKEAAGIQLTREEMDVLYVRYDAPEEGSFVEMMPSIAAPAGDAGKHDAGGGDAVTVDTTESGKKKKKKKKNKKKRGEDGNQNDSNEGSATAADGGDGEPNKTEMEQKKSKKARLGDAPNTGSTFESSSSEPPAKMDIDQNDPAKTSVETANKDADTSTKPAQSFASMMFAGLTSLKTKTDTHNEELADEQARKQAEEDERIANLEEEERKKRKVYVPSETVTVSTMHLLDNEDDDTKNNNDAISKATATSNNKKHNIIQHINRPDEIKESRYDLPVSTMEYEIIDAIRNNDCTILCGETGSGKSTQVPQFLYEAGFSMNGWWKSVTTTAGNAADANSSSSNDAESPPDNNKEHLLIGITQPRRVAAVSTAKRVCYEMGQGNGQSISNNNLVSYQTRYETAGLGSNTHVKFMTDGILLQEIQSDLLLRKYGAIVIDEAHERNLNTDVLLGLLSVALPLRRKAAEEGTMPPLKLVVMSATLRVEDFTENKRLFPEGSANRPALVKVPGRTFPVSIHHSKVTELDDYEKVAMEKVCKIHRKLPAGGILVFLTGKQEIVRCVNRLRQRLEPGKKKKKPTTGGRKTLDEGTDVNQSTTANDAALDGFRDMDDEEVDGDLFQKADDEQEDDYENMENEEDMDIDVEAVEGGDDDKQPKKVRILPLYSMLAADEQAKIFAPVPEDTRLIVVATNIAETSITIPGISYVLDSGRQKCRNYHAGTGVASYDIMWISKAAADQRAGRAGRTGPGHCYRLYSSSVYSRYLDQFALPEVLTRPLEDVVLAMKAMNVSNVTSFPFPTPPEQSQVNAAVRLLANLGCVDVSRVEEQGGDGKITPLGSAVSKLPLGVRYGKMLLVAAQANVLDYAIALVAVLSESTPFVHHTEEVEEKDKSKSDEDDLKGLDDVDKKQVQRKERGRKKEMKSQWQHDGGDVLAAMKAVGAYAYAGRGAGGSSEKLACRTFCEENGLHVVVMQRIAKMRLHLCKLAKIRLPHAGGVASTSGKFLPSMPPPKRIQEGLIRQAIASGLLDNIARRAPPGVLPQEFTGIPRSAYICGNSKLKEPLFIDNNSTVHSKRPEWVCFDSIVRKTKKDGTTVATMQKVTPIDPEWIATLCHGSKLMTLGSPLATPLPRYMKEKDSIQCAVETKFGGHGWEIPPCYLDMYETIQEETNDDKKRQTSAVMEDDSFRWFARYLLEGKVLPDLSDLLSMLNDEPAIITRRKPAKKVLLIVSALSSAGIDSAAALRKHWAEKDTKFLFKALKPWIKKDSVDEFKCLWIACVNSNVDEWKNRNSR